MGSLIYTSGSFANGPVSENLSLSCAKGHSASPEDADIKQNRIAANAKPISCLAILVFLSVAPLAITSSAQQLAAQNAIALRRAQVGEKYSAQIAVGGITPLRCSLVGGELPRGLEFVNGTLEGLPSVAQPMPYVFRLRVSDSSQPAQVIEQEFSLLVAPAPLQLAVNKPPTAVIPGVGISDARVLQDSSVNSLLLVTEQASTGSASNPSGPPESSNAEGKAVPTKNGKVTQLKHSPVAPGTSVVGHGTEGPRNGGSTAGPMLRTIIGFEQAGVSAAQSQQDFFLDLYYDRPLVIHSDDDLGPKLRSWGNLRVSSVPQQINTSVAQFAAQFAQQVGQLKVNQVAQSFEFLGGIEYRLWSSPNTYSSTDPNDSSSTKISANWILGGGVITPLSPQQSVQVFDVPSNQSSFFTQYPQTIGKQYVAFSLLDRNRFFRQAYGGFRLKTNFMGEATRFPETFDLTYGVNESVTGGTIRGGVVRLEGFVPLPYAKASWIYVFGTGLFKPGGRAKTSSPFFLDQATGILPTNPNAIIIPTPQTDRDYYRVGIGIDFVDLIKRWPKGKAAEK